MKPRLILLLVVSHAVVAFIGFAAGIYTLPLLTASAAPEQAQLKSIQTQAEFTASFVRELKGSDSLHWGEGQVSINNHHIALEGELSPGPDFKLYLATEFVETEQEFNALKSKMVQVGSVNRFDNFIVDVPSHINPANYNTVIVWCESFGEFITAAKYQ
ncbi:DM13 domain-containing protein [Shewanella sp. WXL01]|uniref:DM13 domain-containing protein n=1 Tax=Shewanella sp. WXL01 TaxID=2709721 RepID=UPI0014386A64|nr:DM13 domain-containing protein [Shewanella sp. WXL01]NKF49289.1 DM13 domain-containing protein [Shewanella sp. WXL01]